jgi:hypothetical protein
MEVSVARDSVLANKEQHPCKPLKSGIKAGEEFTVSLGINIDEGFVSFVIANVALENYYFTSRWQDYRFYVHVMDQGESIRVIRDEIEQI